MNLGAGIASVAMAALLAGGLAWSGWSLSRAILGAGRRAERLAGALVLAAAILYVLTHATLALGGFGRAALLAALAVVGVAAGAILKSSGVRILVEIDDDLRALGRGFARLPPVWGVATVCVLTLAGVRVFRGLALPPLGWDALVYHLFRAGRWAALGTHHVEAAPGAWGFYEWFPSAGNTLWAWAFVAAPDGAWLAPAGGAVWAIACFAAAFLALRLGATRDRALAAALFTGTVPAIAGAITVSYVDTSLLALFLLGTAFLVRPGAEASLSRGSAFLAGLAMALAGAVKTSFLPAAPLAAALLVLGRTSRRIWAGFLLGAIPPILIEYARPVWETGSPFWPFPVSIFGFPILAGDDELTKQFAGYYAMDVVERTPPFEFLEWLFLWYRLPGSDFAGFGPLSAPILLIGGFALFRLARKAGIGFLAALLAGAVVVAGTLSEGSVALRTVWVGVLGRHLAPVCVLVAAAAATLEARWMRPVWLAAIVAGGVCSLPFGWGEVDVAALAELSLPLLIGILLGAAAGWGAYRLTRKVFWGFVTAGFLFAVPVQATLAELRPAVRWAAWNETVSTDPLYDLHFLDPAAMSAWPAWRRLDDGGPHTVAVSAGYAREGQSWYLYPLLGSRLQNRVVFVPPTSDGRVPDYRDPGGVDRVLDEEAWVDRLRAGGIDFVMCLWPPSPECARWVLPRADRFPAEAAVGAAGWSLHRFEPAPSPSLGGTGR